MQPFKKMIFMLTRTSSLPSSFAYSVINGTISCSGGVLAFSTIGSVMVYSSAATLTTGVSLYDSPSLTTLVTYTGLKGSGTVLYELTSGVIDIVSSIGDSC